MQSYVLHLARSTERQGLVKDLLATLPQAQVLPAVEGSVLSEAEKRDAYEDHAIEPHYPFGSKAGELGCFLSHRKFWQALVDSDEAMMWIAEDDVAISQANFKTLEGLIMPHADTNSLIRVPIRNREIADRVIAQDGDMRLVRPKVIGLTTAMYLIGRDAAQRLLDVSQPFDRPVDTFMQMRWLTGVDSLTVLNSGARSAAFEVGGSTIQSKKSVIQETKRMFARARYRAHVRRLSAKAMS
jgi:GR25 family glycosyltransferase involved in LPS biosynthesis